MNYSPELRLVLEVLRRAILDSIRGVAHDKRDAQGWLRSKATHPFSALWCLEMLNLDRDRILAIAFSDTLIGQYEAEGMLYIGRKRNYDEDYRSIVDELSNDVTYSALRYVG
jgi:hypothetical protein